MEFILHKESLRSVPQLSKKRLREASCVEKAWNDLDKKAYALCILQLICRFGDRLLSPLVVMGWHMTTSFLDLSGLSGHH